MHRPINPVHATLLAATVFLTGTTYGIGLSRPQDTASADNPSAIELVKGSGANGPSAASVVADKRSDTADGLAETPKSGRPAAPRTPQALAKQALKYTVLVRGKGVYGSGVLVGSAGHVITCWHVIEGLKEIEVTFANQAPRSAELLDRDVNLDLAVLKVDMAPPAKGPRLASVADIAVGDEVYSMGAPRRMTFSLSHGMVSYVGRTFDGLHFVQTDLPINVGSSGGPVLNSRGELLGISTFVLRDSEGLAFAIPIDYAYRRFAGIFEQAFNAEGFDKWLAERPLAKQKK